MPLSPRAFEQVLLACVTSNSERRETTRTATAMRVAVSRAAQPALAATNVDLIDISAEGMGFVSSSRMKVGEQIATELPVVGQPPIRLIAEVRHCRLDNDGRFTIGARFVDEQTDPALLGN